MAEINQFINYVKLPNNDARGIQTYHSLTIGDQVFNGSNPVTITAANLGLSQALKFVGSTPDIMADKQTTLPSNISITTPSIGDVVLSNGNGEFVWLGSNWEQLGSEESYALKTVQIVTDANSGLKGGSSLAGNVTLSINYAGNSPVMNGTSSAGSSIYPARADHIHPSDTSKFNVSGGTITGATTISNTLTVSNTATFNNKTKIGGRLVLTSNAYGSSLPSGTFDAGTIFFKLV